MLTVEWKDVAVSTGTSGYHHGNLRAALLTAAIESLEAGETFSLRAIARRVGVSPTAPYRHFTDRGELESAVAAEGLKDLRADLAAASTDPAVARSPVDVLAPLASAYVTFALRRPAVFRLMFGNECDEANTGRAVAAGEVHEALAGVVGRLFPTSDVQNLATAMWSMAHGLAFLHLDGTFRPGPPIDVEKRIRAAVTAVLIL